jgi:hypothetical protein
MSGLPTIHPKTRRKLQKEAVPSEGGDIPVITYDEEGQPVADLNDFRAHLRRLELPLPQ